VVINAQHPKAEPLKGLVACSIVAHGIWLTVLGSVKLDHKLGSRYVEVNNVGPDGLLTTHLEPAKPFATEP
jgi:predicted class III extradiol MEMO1 family dioxygenase